MVRVRDMFSKKNFASRIFPLMVMRYSSPSQRWSTHTFSAAALDTLPWMPNGSPWSTLGAPAFVTPQVVSSPT